ncbi:hypothetical protein OG497_38045 [Streptomyces sp. NBC_01242]|uniref:hypothetical protein n=1 Tax=Streptomyces sp. NBC_01242 TaxID=2903795 RepID=UPI002250F32F|nr:hypothetical protein [Streptomyces sp. NBC_01242]MCX4799662.1 hypothetical protein [Streptomyces sp. NBC_01242]
MTHTTLVVLLGITIWCALGMAALHAMTLSPMQFMKELDTAPPMIRTLAEARPALFVAVLVLQTVLFLAVWPLMLLWRIATLDYAYGWHRLTSHPLRPCTDEEIAEQEAEDSKA